MMRYLFAAGAAIVAVLVGCVKDAPPPAPPSPDMADFVAYSEADCWMLDRVFAQYEETWQATRESTGSTFWEVMGADIYEMSRLRGRDEERETGLAALEQHLSAISDAGVSKACDGYPRTPARPMSECAEKKATTVEDGEVVIECLRWKN